MSRQRMVSTRIWNDNWVSHLDPVEKLLFIYLITNEHTNLSGIYELPLRVISAETGIDHAMILKMMLRLSPKVYYEEGWVILVNFPRHQDTHNPKIMAGIQRELGLVPSKIHTLSIGYGYPIALNLTKPNSITAEAVTVIEDSPFIEESPAKVSKYPHRDEVYALWGKWPLNWKIAAPQSKAAENLYKERGLEQIKAAIAFWREHKEEPYCPDCSTPYRLDSNWSSLFKFKAKNGL